MRAVVWFRAAAVLMLLFAVGHTYGFLAFRPDTAEGRAVWEAMNSVRLSAGRETFSYGGFYTGFGLSISAFDVFSAWLAWTLGSMAGAGEMRARPIGWAMFVLQCVGFVLSLRYFSIVPAVLSAVAALLFLVAAVSVRPAKITAG
ncbi:LIC_13387 family protein [Tunturiibacter gelidiferens]|uniref:LIC_13387 family protein n=1 Tax=Tunturiibacter gelidiferens TaxID=3069689 RepID=UPI003D9BFAE5